MTDQQPKRNPQVNENLPPTTPILPSQLTSGRRRPSCGIAGRRGRGGLEGSPRPPFFLVAAGAFGGAPDLTVPARGRGLVRGRVRRRAPPGSPAAPPPAAARRGRCRRPA